MDGPDCSAVRVLSKWAELGQGAIGAARAKGKLLSCFFTSSSPVLMLKPYSFTVSYDLRLI
jgi:hypothetical protein